MQKLEAQPTVGEVKVIVLSQPKGNAPAVDAAGGTAVCEMARILNVHAATLYRALGTAVLGDVPGRLRYQACDQNLVYCLQVGQARSATHTYAGLTAGVYRIIVESYPGAEGSTIACVRASSSSSRSWMVAPNSARRAFASGRSRCCPSRCCS